MPELQERLVQRASTAAAQLKVLRSLPQTEGTVRAERRILNQLNVTELGMVASLLADLEIAAPPKQQQPEVPNA